MADVFKTVLIRHYAESMYNFVDGPFKKFHGHWRFTGLREDACKVEFKLHYEFSSLLLEKIIGPVFNVIASTFVDGFVKRADQVYGEKN